MKPRQRLKALYERLLPTFPIELIRLTRDCRSILDVGCGSDSRVGRLPNTIHKVGVDGFGQSLELSRQRGLHHEYRLMHVLDIGKAFAEGSFDCVLACDVIEHLEKADGLKLMAMLERIARKKVIIKTPNGFLRQGEYENNPLQIHRSGWEVAEMRLRGYRVIGVGGWKGLKGERAELKFKPERFWRVIADLTRPLTRNAPRCAIEIICVKEKTAADRDVAMVYLPSVP